MAKGVRMRLLSQSLVIWSPVNVEEFIETGAADERDRVERIPYDPELMKALVASGRLG